MRRLGVGAVVTGARSGELEAFDGEGKVLVIGVVDKEAVVDALLDAFGFVAFRNEGARSSGFQALFDARRLGEGFVVGLDAVDDDAPFSVDVHGSERLDVSGFAGAEISFLDDFLQTIHGILGVGQDVLVQLLDGVIVVFEGGLNVIGGVFLILQTPRLRVIYGAFRSFIVGLFMRVGSGVMRSGVMRCGVMRSGVVGSRVIRSGGIRCGGIRCGGIDGFMVVRCRFMVIRCWFMVVDGGFMVNGFVVVRGGGRSVAVDRSWGVSIRCRSHGFGIWASRHGTDHRRHYKINKGHD